MIDIFRLLIWSCLNSRLLKNNYPNITLANKHLIYFHIYFDIYIIFISRFGALRDLNSRSKKPVRPLPLHPSTLRRMHPAGKEIQWTRWSLGSYCCDNPTLPNISGNHCHFPQTSCQDCCHVFPTFFGENTATKPSGQKIRVTKPGRDKTLPPP